MLRSSFRAVAAAAFLTFAAAAMAAQSEPKAVADPAEAATAPNIPEVAATGPATAAPDTTSRCAQLQAELDTLQRKLIQSSNETSRLALDMQRNLRRNAKRARAAGMLSRFAGLIPGAGAFAGMGSSLLGGGMASPRLDPAMDGRIEEQLAISEQMLQISNGLTANRCPAAGALYSVTSLPDDPGRETQAADAGRPASTRGD